MIGVLGHVDVPPLLPPPLLVLLAGAAVVVPARLDRGHGDPPWRLPVAAPLAAHPTATGITLLLAAAAAAWATATAGQPGPVLAGVWLTVTAASLAFGRLWQVGNPLRLLVRALTRIIDPEEAGVAALPRGLSGAVAAAGLFVLGWLQHAPLSSAAVAAALGAYLVLHLLAGLVWGPGWFARAEAVEVYSSLVGDAVRPRTANGEQATALTPASQPGLAVLAALVAVPFSARITHQPAWLEVTAGLAGGHQDLAAVALLAGLGLLAFAALRTAGRGRAAEPLAVAAVAVFASHQLALLVSPPLAVQAETAATDARLVAATVLPLLLLLAGVAYASYQLQRGTRPLPTRQARALRVPAQVLLGVLAVTAALLWAVPL
jgi:hypothetical protein